MHFYVILLACVVASLTSLIAMLCTKTKPPVIFDNWIYSETHLARWLEKKCHLKPVIIDKFHMAGFHAFVALTVISAIITFIDIFSNYVISNSIGFISMCVTFLAIIILPLLYESFIVIWWSILNYNYARKNKNDIKKIKHIIKEVTQKTKKGKKRTG